MVIEVFLPQVVGTLKPSIISFRPVLPPVLPLSHSLSCPLSHPVSHPLSRSLSHSLIPCPSWWWGPYIVPFWWGSILVGTLKPSIISFCPVSPSVLPLSRSLSCPLFRTLSCPLSHHRSHCLSHSLTPCPSWWWGPYIVAFWWGH